MEEEWIQKTCEQIAAFKPDVVITGGGHSGALLVGTVTLCSLAQRPALPSALPSAPPSMWHGFLHTAVQLAACWGRPPLGRPCPTQADSHFARPFLASPAFPLFYCLPPRLLHLAAEKGLSDLAAHYLMKEGISAIRRLRKTDNNRVARACGATIVSRAGARLAAAGGCGCGCLRSSGAGGSLRTHVTACGNLWKLAPPQLALLLPCPAPTPDSLHSTHAQPWPALTCTALPSPFVAVSSSPADEIRESDIGTGAGLFEVRKIGDEFYTFIVDCKVRGARRGIGVRGNGRGRLPPQWGMAGACGDV